VENPSPALSVVVPIYNEAQSLPDLLPAWVQTCENHGWDLILVDDGSRDETQSLIQGYRDLPWVKIIRHKVNRGYGGAVKSGIANVQTDYLVTIDADGQHDIADVEKVFQFALENDADMVIGDRSMSQQSGWYREIGKRLILLFTNLLMRQHINDLNTGFRLMRSELAGRYLYLLPNTFAFCVVVTLFFISQRHLVMEYPVSCVKRKAGRSTINTYTAFQTLIEVINIIMLFNPLKIFLPLAAVCIAVGILWGIPYVVMGHGVSVGSMLAIVIGALFFFLGLLASQLSAIRMELGDFQRKGEIDDGKPPNPAPGSGLE
jgi:glycosyltransferase involved in cell wall biosynthesis